MNQLAISLALAMTLLSGCATTPASDDGGLAAGPPPGDFSVDLTVLSGSSLGNGQPVDRRTARYTLFPDGTLHMGEGPDLTANDLVPYSRTLSESRIAEVWQAVQQVNALEGDGNDPGNPELVGSEDGQLTWVLSIHADGRQYRVSGSVAADEAMEPGLRTLTRTLAALAWATDEPATTALRIPRRYDFGPDPYAPYRDNTADDDAETGEEDGQ